LPYGLRKRVELGRALVSRPVFLLLDEPMAEMSQAEKTEISRCRAWPVNPRVIPRLRRYAAATTFWASATTNAMLFWIGAGIIAMTAAPVLPKCYRPHWVGERRNLFVHHGCCPIKRVHDSVRMSRLTNTKINQALRARAAVEH
jgi:hypothetical protein